MESYISQNQRSDVPTIGKLGKLSYDDFRRIINKVEGSPSIDECWIWTGASANKTGKGHQHGIFSYNNKHVLLHRIMYHNFKDNVPEYSHLPETLIVLHNCNHLNNGKCINPIHLRLGTTKENTRDALEAGTITAVFRKNEDSPVCKFSDIQISEMRNLLESGSSRKEVYEKYNISFTHLSRIWQNKGRKEETFSPTNIPVIIRNKISESQKIEIVNLIRSGITQKEVSLRYNISSSQVSRIWIKFRQ